MNKILHQSIPASPIKSLGRAPGLANAWPLGSTRFANAPPPGLTMRANANGVGGGGDLGAAGIDGCIDIQ